MLKRGGGGRRGGELACILSFLNGYEFASKPEDSSSNNFNTIKRPLNVMTSFFLLFVFIVTSIDALKISITRRSLLATSSTLLLPLTAPDTAYASNPNPTYPVTRTDREWSYMLSGQQYNVLRQGGTGKAVAVA